MATEAVKRRHEAPALRQPRIGEYLDSRHSAPSEREAAWALESPAAIVPIAGTMAVAETQSQMDVDG